MLRNYFGKCPCQAPNCSSGLTKLNINKIATQYVRDWLKTALLIIHHRNIIMFLRNGRSRLWFWLRCREMSTSESSSESWRGDLNSSYPIGPGFAGPDGKLIMHVNTVTTVRKYYDVFGAIQGTQEPGSHVPNIFPSVARNTKTVWPCRQVRNGRAGAKARPVLDCDLHGADPVSGGSEKHKRLEFRALRVSTYPVNEALVFPDWRPSRSVVFASWGMETLCYSHAKDWWLQQQMRTVAYLKIDSVLLGTIQT